jgi:hypothetical protein
MPAGTIFCGQPARCLNQLLWEKNDAFYIWLCVVVVVVVVVVVSSATVTLKKDLFCLLTTNGYCCLSA